LYSSVSPVIIGYLVIPGERSKMSLPRARSGQILKTKALVDPPSTSLRMKSLSNRGLRPASQGSAGMTDCVKASRAHL
jgi:hypothetical protein